MLAICKHCEYWNAPADYSGDGPQKCKCKTSAHYRKMKMFDDGCGEFKLLDDSQ